MKKEYLITEKPWKALLLFAAPMIIGNLFQQFYTMVDSIVVGRFVSENALAAVGASYALTTVFISIAIGGGVVISRYYGAKQVFWCKGLSEDDAVHPHGADGVSCDQRCAGRRGAFDWKADHDSAEYAL